MGTLYLVSTPIGNLEDITIRATKIFVSVDILLCEDTRRTGILLDQLNISPKPTLMQFYEDIEDKKTPEIIELLLSGKNIALVSDAGTPLISDPGHRLVREAIKRHIPVVAIPGASALLTALVASGLPSNTFTFLGFAPEKEAHRRKLFTNLLGANKALESTYILYCAPHKLAITLMTMKEILGDVSIVLARELTKIHEEFFRGTISEAETHFEHPKGEFVLLFHLSYR